VNYLGRPLAYDCAEDLRFGDAIPPLTTCRLMNESLSDRSKGLHMLRGTVEGVINRRFSS
jgi:hypothetical protein